MYLRDQIYKAVAHSDVDRMQKLVIKFERLERVFNAKEEEKYRKNCEVWETKYHASYPWAMNQCYVGAYYHELLCEMNRDWDGALRYIDEYMRLDADKSTQRAPYFDDSDVEPLRARVRYKMGDKEGAFKDYCNLAPKNAPEGYDAHFIKNRLCIYVGSLPPPYKERAFSRFCFDSYDDFLLFMEKEYAKLGSPDEYREAMEIYRAMKDDA